MKPQHPVFSMPQAERVMDDCVNLKHYNVLFETIGVFKWSAIPCGSMQWMCPALSGAKFHQFPLWTWHGRLVRKAFCKEMSFGVSCNQHSGLVPPCSKVRFFPPHQRNYEGYAQAWPFFAAGQHSTVQLALRSRLLRTEIWQVRIRVIIYIYIYKRSSGY